MSLAYGTGGFIRSDVPIDVKCDVLALEKHVYEYNTPLFLLKRFALVEVLIRHVHGSRTTAVAHGFRFRSGQLESIK